jgi:predicted DNA-binding transcriptional regulator YafY
VVTVTNNELQKKKNARRPREDTYTIARRLMYILNLLRQHSSTRKLDTNKAHKQLLAQGHEVSLRTVQRYFKDFFDHYDGVKKDDSSPPGYWYEATVREDMLHLSRESALAVCLVEAHLKHLLPSNEMKHLRPIFEHASKVLEKARATKRYNELLKRIAIFPRGWKLIAPHISNPKIFDDVMSAITDSRTIKMTYQSAKEKKPRERTIEPLGLVDRSGVYYVVGREIYGSSDYKNWALHRIVQLEVLSEFSYPKNFQLRQHAAEGNLNRIHSATPLKVVLRLSSEAGAHLREGECKISDDQQILKQTENFIEISCTVRDSDEFRWWILEKGAGCEVVSPLSLREEISETLNNALSVYKANLRNRAS